MSIIGGNVVVMQLVAFGATFFWRAKRALLSGNQGSAVAKFKKKKKQIHFEDVASLG